MSVFQFPKDVAGEMVFDLGMARDRLTGMGSRILIPVVSAAVTNQNTSVIFNFIDQIVPFHPTAISPCLRIPGIFPVLIS